MKSQVFCALLFFGALLAVPAPAQEILERVDDWLSWRDARGGLSVDLSFLQDTEFYAAEAQPQGLLATEADTFLQPRLAAFLDLRAGERWRLHAQARLDSGFDPGFSPDGALRLDEYFLEWKPLGDDRLQLRAGKFATVFGGWPRRNLSWDNPLVSAPGLYDTLLPVSDDGLPGDAGLFLNRRGAPANKRTWLPVIWGPAYITGAAVSGVLGDFDYAFEVKTAAPSAQPDVWDAFQSGFDDAHFAGRLGWRPAPEWTLGGSFARGPYLRTEAADHLPAGMNRRDFQQTTLGIDAGYAHGPWQIWAELAGAEFEVPAVGGARVLTGYVEARRKLGAGTWLSARWNQAWFDDAPGTDTAWDSDGWRLDLGLGHRFTRHLQMKAQYSLAGRSDDDHPEGRHLLALQFSVRF